MRSCWLQCVNTRRPSGRGTRTTTSVRTWAARTTHTNEILTTNLDFEFPHCPRKLADQRSLSSHITKHHQSDFTCPDCHKKLGTALALENHINSPTACKAKDPDNTWACKLCRKYWCSSRKSLNRQEKTCKEESVTSPQCGKDFPNHKAAALYIDYRYCPGLVSLEKRNANERTQTKHARNHMNHVSKGIPAPSRILLTTMNKERQRSKEYSLDGLTWS